MDYGWIQEEETEEHSNIVCSGQSAFVHTERMQAATHSLAIKYTKALVISTVNVKDMRSFMSLENIYTRTI